VSDSRLRVRSPISERRSTVKTENGSRSYDITHIILSVLFIGLFIGPVLLAAAGSALRRGRLFIAFSARARLIDCGPRVSEEA
jgi:hypothetical protein